MKNLIFSLIICCCFYCCNNTSLKKSQFYNCKKEDKVIEKLVDSIYYENILGKSSNAYIKYINELKVEDIRNGYDGLVFRTIYSDIVNGDATSMNEIKFDGKNKIVDCKTIFYEYKTDGSIKIIKTDKLVPKTGWINFEKKFLELDILNIRNQTSIKSYKTYMDANGVGIEFANCNKYLYYTYSYPWGNKDINEAQKIIKFFNLLKEEFGTDLRNFK